jgi:hypothetical protein
MNRLKNYIKLISMQGGSKFQDYLNIVINEVNPVEYFNKNNVRKLFKSDPKYEPNDKDLYDKVNDKLVADLAAFTGNPSTGLDPSNIPAVKQWFKDRLSEYLSTQTGTRTLDIIRAEVQDAFDSINKINDDCNTQFTEIQSIETQLTTEKAEQANINIVQQNLADATQPNTNAQAVLAQALPILARAKATIVGADAETELANINALLTAIRGYAADVSTQVNKARATKALHDAEIAKLQGELNAITIPATPYKKELDAVQLIQAQFPFKLKKQLDPAVETEVNTTQAGIVKTAESEIQSQQKAIALELTKLSNAKTFSVSKDLNALKVAKGDKDNADANIKSITLTVLAAEASAKKALAVAEKAIADNKGSMDTLIKRFKDLLSKKLITNLETNIKAYLSSTQTALANIKALASTAVSALASTAVSTQKGIATKAESDINDNLLDYKTQETIFNKAMSNYDTATVKLLPDATTKKILQDAEDAYAEIKRLEGEAKKSDDSAQKALISAGHAVAPHTAPKIQVEYYDSYEQQYRTFNVSVYITRNNKDTFIGGSSVSKNETIKSILSSFKQNCKTCVVTSGKQYVKSLEGKDLHTELANLVLRYENIDLFIVN